MSIMLHSFDHPHHFYFLCIPLPTSFDLYLSNRPLFTPLPSFSFSIFFSLCSQNHVCKLSFLLCLAISEGRHGKWEKYPYFPLLVLLFLFLGLMTFSFTLDVEGEKCFGYVMSSCYVQVEVGFPSG